MKGILVTNNFCITREKEHSNRHLIESARKQNVELTEKKTGELLHNPNYLKDLEADFILFQDKDVILAKLLEMSGFPVFNKASAIEDCDNKARTFLRLTEKGLPVPLTLIAPLTFEGFGYNNENFLEEAASLLGFPMVVKELHGSYGQQVYLAHSMEELSALSKGFGHKGFLMQELVNTSFGKDIRVNVVGGRAISAILRHNDSGDFRSNIFIGGNASAHTLTPEEESLAVSACEALSLDYAGVDLLFGPDGPLVCEVNSNAHFKASLECTGVDPSEHIIAHIISSLS